MNRVGACGRGSGACWVTRGCATLVEEGAARVGRDDLLSGALATASRPGDCGESLAGYGLAFVLDLAFALWVADMGGTH